MLFCLLAGSQLPDPDGNAEGDYAELVHALLCAGLAVFECARTLTEDLLWRQEAVALKLRRQLNPSPVLTEL